MYTIRITGCIQAKITNSTVTVGIIGKQCVNIFAVHIIFGDMAFIDTIHENINSGAICWDVFGLRG